MSYSTSDRAARAFDDVHTKPRMKGRLDYGKLSIIYTCSPDGKDMDIDDVTLQGFSGKGLGGVLCEALMHFANESGEPLLDMVRQQRNTNQETEEV